MFNTYGNYSPRVLPPVSIPFSAGIVAGLFSSQHMVARFCVPVLYYLP